MALIEKLSRPIYRLGLLMGVKSGTTDTAAAVGVTDDAAHALTHSLDSTTGNLVADQSVGGAKLVSQASLLAFEDEPNGVAKVEQRFAYETVAASQTAQPLGTTGTVGDFLHRLVCVVATSATSAVTLNDGGGSEIPIIPANAPIGAHPIEINIYSLAGSWRVTTAAGVTVLAAGRFS